MCAAVSGLSLGTFPPNRAQTFTGLFGDDLFISGSFCASYYVCMKGKTSTTGTPCFVTFRSLLDEKIKLEEGFPSLAQGIQVISFHNGSRKIAVSHRSLISFDKQVCGTWQV